jgi:hypothetical protein
MKTSVFCLLICALMAFAAADSSSIRIELSPESNSNWIAIAVHNGSVDTSLVHIQEAGRATWELMEHKDEHWTYTPSSDVWFPLSFIFTSVNGEKVLVNNAIYSLKQLLTDTKEQYLDEVQEDRLRSTRKKHTTAPTPKPSKSSTTTTTKKPSGTTTTKKPSTTTTTKKPSGTTGAGGCSDIKLLVPLYVDPGTGTAWADVASGAASVQTVAIINPNSGPGGAPSSAYTSGMSKLAAAGVEMIGYVHTSYGDRAIADVQADIDTYATEWPGLVGIFIDECAATADEVSYYEQVYNIIMSYPNFKYDIINPGTVPTSGYSAVSTQIVAYEDTAASFASSENPTFASCSNFAMIAYAASGTSTMESILADVKSKGYYGWAYVTDGAAGGETYNALASYYASEASYFASDMK